MKMDMTSMLIGLLILAGVIFILNYVALEYYLYWVFWWYDIMMHFLGGVLVGGSAVWARLRFDPTASWGSLIVTTLVSIALIGIGWEVFEYMSGAFIGESSIVADTVQDLIVDTLGALTACWLSVSLLRSTTQEQETYEQ